MQQGDHDPLSEATVRKAWQQLIAEDLPRAARQRGWPQRTPSEFERVLLDQVLETPCEADTSRCTCPVNLILAIELAEQALQGKVCLSAMERRSQAMRLGLATGDAAAKSATRRLLADLAKPVCGSPRKQRS